MVVDTAEGVISHMQAYFADGRDSQYLPEITLQLQNCLKENELQMNDLLADTGYPNGPNYSFLEQKGITGWVPVFGMCKPVVPDFIYNQETDEYICPAGKPIPFKKFDHTDDGRLLKKYWLAPKDCKAHPRKPSYIPDIYYKRIVRTPYDGQYQKAHDGQQGKRDRQMKKLRQSTTRPMFDSLIYYYGLSKIGVLSKARYHKAMPMAGNCLQPQKVLENRRKQTFARLL